MSGAVQHSAMRASNLALVLGAVAEGGSVTRSQVTARTGLTKSSVAGLVADLITTGLVAEQSAAAAASGTRERGRPGGVLTLARQGAAGLGLEINVDYLAALVTDLDGGVRYRHVVGVDNRGRPAGEVLVGLADLAEGAAGAAAEQELPLAGVCIAVPGTVAGDRVLRAPNLDWTEVAVEPPLPRTPFAPTLENEANLAALAELWSGSAPRDFVHVSGEIGIGGGVVIDGELFRGAHGRAGELGHVVIDPDGPPCSCGGRGCLERLAGQDAILAAAGAPTRAVLEERCAAGDPVALEAVTAAGRHLGTALASVTNLFDPECVVLGGAFAALAPWLAQAVEETLARHGVRTGVGVSTLGTDAAVRGAAASVVRRVIADPAAYLALREGAA